MKRERRKRRRRRKKKRRKRRRKRQGKPCADVPSHLFPSMKWCAEYEKASLP